MSTSDSPLPAHWQFYTERARQTHYGRVDDRGYGREELLWETLAAIQSGIPFTEDCRQRLDRIPWNRSKKHRRLRVFLLLRRSAGRKSGGVDRYLGRKRFGGEKHIEGIRVHPGSGALTCRKCSNAMTPAEEAIYGSKCEDCWAGRAAETVVEGAGAIVQGISVDQVQGMLSPGEWEVECRLAAGQSYAEVAGDGGLSADALKERASRWRARIRPKLTVLAWGNC